MQFALLAFIVLGLIGGRIPRRGDPITQPQIIIEDGVYMGGQLPQFGELCQEATVYGGPDAAIYPVMATLPAGEIVSLHELGRADSSWVMIAKARWIKLLTVCDW